MSQQPIPAQPQPTPALKHSSLPPLASTSRLKTPPTSPPLPTPAPITPATSVHGRVTSSPITDSQLDKLVHAMYPTLPSAITAALYAHGVRTVAAFESLVFVDDAVIHELFNEFVGTSCGVSTIYRRIFFRATEGAAEEDAWRGLDVVVQRVRGQRELSLTEILGYVKLSEKALFYNTL